MAVTITGKKKDKPASKESKAGTGKKKKLSWMKTGKDAAEAMERHEEQVKARQEESGKMFRFYLVPGEDAQLTFLDGDLDSDGVLTAPLIYEHRALVNGRWTNFPCPTTRDPNEPCPFCDEDDRSSMVMFFTVINHTPYKVKNGPNAGKVLENRRQLFVPTAKMIKVLQKIAVTQGGLTGLLVETSRTGDMEPRVGNLIQPVEKRDMADLIEEYGEENCQPADYEEEITFRDADELKALGIGASAKTVGDEEAADLDEEM